MTNGSAPPLARRLLAELLGSAFLAAVVIGAAWLLLLPLNEYSRHTYISENALLPGQVHAYFSGSDQNAKQINGIRPPTSNTELITLNLLDAAKTVITLTGLFPDSKNNAPFLEADAGRPESTVGARDNRGRGRHEFR